MIERIFDSLVLIQEDTTTPPLNEVGVKERHTNMFIFDQKTYKSVIRWTKPYNIW